MSYTLKRAEYDLRRIGFHYDESKAVFVYCSDGWDRRADGSFSVDVNLAADPPLVHARKALIYNGAVCYSHYSEAELQQQLQSTTGEGERLRLAVDAARTIRRHW